MIKVLLISYYFDPFPGVGAKRLTYWHEHFSEFQIESEVITATKQVSEKPKVTFVPDSGNSGLIGKVIKDPGLSWAKDLKSYFENKPELKFDYVIFSGGPFMHFSMVKYLKNRLNCQVALDYRDPFALNPRMKGSAIKNKVKLFYEKKFNKSADLVFTVNDVCKNVLAFPDKIDIISNGFDDSAMKSLPAITNLDSKFVNLFIGGKLYSDCPIVNLVEVVQSKKQLKLKQIGFKYAELDDLKDERISSIGFMSYLELMRELQSAEIAVLMTGGKAFESPTKMYDYLGFNKKILVITEGGKKKGVIGDVLSSYPNVEWANNNSPEIQNAINKLIEKEVQPFDTTVFARKNGLQKLTKILKSKSK